MKNERNFILSDVLICAALKVEADAVGVSLEEYVNKFLEAFYKDPENFYPLLNK